MNLITIKRNIMGVLTKSEHIEMNMYKINEYKYFQN